MPFPQFASLHFTSPRGLIRLSLLGLLLPLPISAQPAPAPLSSPQTALTQVPLAQAVPPQLLPTQPQTLPPENLLPETAALELGNLVGENLRRFQELDITQPLFSLEGIADQADLQFPTATGAVSDVMPQLLAPELTQEASQLPAAK